jgi:hypothetical protein
MNAVDMNVSDLTQRRKAAKKTRHISIAGLGTIPLRAFAPLREILHAIAFQIGSAPSTPTNF